MVHLYRVGRGIWRRGAETPEAVKWEDRIIEIREGPWSYIAGTVGIAPGESLFLLFLMNLHTTGRGKF